MSTLNVLNTNSADNTLNTLDTNLSNATGGSTNTPRSAISSTASEDDGTPATELGRSSGSRPGSEMETRLSRLEKNGDALLRGIMPLLENMNSMLAELRRDNSGAGRELSSLVDSALASAGVSVDGGLVAPSHSASASRDTFLEDDALHDALPPGGEAQQALEEDFRAPQFLPRTQSMPLEKIPEPPVDSIMAEASDKPLPPPPGSLTRLRAVTVVETRRSPEQHEAEAQRAILKRMQEQETLMDGLMTRWGLPGINSSNSTTSQV